MRCVASFLAYPSQLVEIPNHYPPTATIFQHPSKAFDTFPRDRRVGGTNAVFRLQWPARDHKTPWAIENERFTTGIAVIGDLPKTAVREQAAEIVGQI